MVEQNSASQRLPTHEEIAKRAYQIYHSRGGTPAHDVDDWLQAEYELIQLPIREIAKLNPPPPAKGRAARKSLVALVRAAMY